MPHEHEYDPTLQTPVAQRSLLSQGILRLRRLFVQTANIKTLRTNTITERTSDAGVMVDRVLLKDKEVNLENAGGTLGVTLKQAAVGADELHVRNKADDGFASLSALSGTYSDYLKVVEQRYPIQAELTIATGAITVTGTFHLVDTESDAASDDLDTINGTMDGSFIILHPANDARTIVIKHDTGNVSCVGQADITLDDIEDFAIGVFSVVDSKWFMLSGHDHLNTFSPYRLTVEDPIASEDITIGFTNEAITITEIRAVLLGSATPSVTWTIRHGTDRSLAGAEVVTGGTTTTSTTTGSDVTVFNDATIPTDSHIWLETTAQSGTVTEIAITIIGTVD